MANTSIEDFGAYEQFGLSYRLSQTAAFREKAAEKHPHDTRNYKAIELLSELIDQTPSQSTIKGLNDAIIAYEFSCAGVEFDIDPPPFETKVSASLGAIGFSWHPKNIDEVVAALTTDAHVATDEVKAMQV